MQTLTIFLRMLFDWTLDTFCVQVGVDLGQCTPGNNVQIIYSTIHSLSSESQLAYQLQVPRSIHLQKQASQYIEYHIYI
jgi:hypothetical protein